MLAEINHSISDRYTICTTSITSLQVLQVYIFKGLSLLLFLFGSPQQLCEGNIIIIVVTIIPTLGLRRQVWVTKCLVQSQWPGKGNRVVALSHSPAVTSWWEPEEHILPPNPAGLPGAGGGQRLSLYCGGLAGWLLRAASGGAHAVPDSK